VAWKGHGVTLVAERDQRTRRRLHHLEASFEHTRDAVFRTPLTELPRPATDGAWRSGARYEYRRYLFEDVIVDGFDLGLGVLGGGEFSSVTQRHDPSIDVRVRTADLTIGVVTAARLRRWRRVQVEAAWVNGGVIGRATKRHSTAAQETVRDWGGGWLTDLMVRADVRYSNTVTLFVSYFGTERARYALHDVVASGRRRVTVGVAYGR
jgi:hypothetical protein